MLNTEIECSNFIRSGYEILKLFNEDTPVSYAEAFQTLCANRTRILLGATGTVAGYIHTIHLCNGELSYIDGGYILTQRGLRERERLKKIIDKADGVISVAI